MRQHGFTDNEAGLICRALNIYADVMKWERSTEWDEITSLDVHELAQRIASTQYRQPVHRAPIAADDPRRVHERCSWPECECGPLVFGSKLRPARYHSVQGSIMIDATTLAPLIGNTVTDLVTGDDFVQFTIGKYTLSIRANAMNISLLVPVGYAEPTDLLPYRPIERPTP